MLRSLVGSEMCIRDSFDPARNSTHLQPVSPTRNSASPSPPPALESPPLKPQRDPSTGTLTPTIHLSPVHVARGARQLFERFDSNQDGMLDALELSALIRRLWTVCDGMQLEAEVATAIAKFGQGQTGMICFPGFVRMVCARPWSKLLPSRSQAALTQISNNTIHE
eukprot:TRINITY_DN34670_c0_g1_i1.p1 TRINITY_DN34670_c0_g1~~TRINITY_DN34670_c0_g1_i1.p1  ORF type:complete len:191 (+),score=44.46 TRINITY_DN34670_c0_g1_i1:77-574(+)